MAKEAAMTDASEEASTSSVTLPPRKVFLTSLSTIAFVSGLGIATVITIRRGRRMRLEEMEVGGRSSTKGKEVMRELLPSRDDSILGSASAKGPLSLFREMNRAAFSRKSSQHPSTVADSSIPSSLRGRQAKASVFDSSAAAAPPSILMRASKKDSSNSEAKRKASAPLQTEGSRTVEPSSILQAEESIAESPAILAVKAIAIATALVGTGAFLVWEAGRRILGVRDIDELVDRLATAIPARTKDKQALSNVGEAARASLKARVDDEEWSSDHLDPLNEQHSSSPMPLDEALTVLDEAATRGDPASWFQILSRQLNAERAQDLEQRRRRMDRQREMAHDSTRLV